jgi:hypothetical protein
MTNLLSGAPVGGPWHRSAELALRENTDRPVSKVDEEQLRQGNAFKHLREAVG